MGTITFYKQININPHFSLSYFAPLIKRAVEDNKAYYVTDGVELGGMLYNVSFEPDTMQLVFLWEEDGEKIEQRVQIISERSNLPTRSGSSVYYFLCPRLGVKCRKLYRIGSFFWSRRAFKAYYPNQMESHSTRQISYRDEPYRKNGKTHYRGKLTPYGQRCKRYEEREVGASLALSMFIDRL